MLSWEMLTEKDIEADAGRGPSNVRYLPRVAGGVEGMNLRFHRVKVDYTMS